jgi:hypothetical protein
MNLSSRLSRVARHVLGAAASLIVLGLSACNDDVASPDPYDITVFESRGLQCEVGSTPQQSGLKLIQQGLDVRRSGCGVMRNVAFPAVCGAPSGLILLHAIPSVSSAAAEQIGFKSVDTLRNGYDWVDCDTGRVLP